MANKGTEDMLHTYFIMSIINVWFTVFTNTSNLKNLNVKLHDEKVYETRDTRSYQRFFLTKSFCQLAVGRRIPPPVLGVKSHFITTPTWYVRVNSVKVYVQQSISNHLSDWRWSLPIWEKVESLKSCLDDIRRCTAPVLIWRVRNITNMLHTSFHKLYVHHHGDAPFCSSP